MGVVGWVHEVGQGVKKKMRKIQVDGVHKSVDLLLYSPTYVYLFMISSSSPLSFAAQSLPIILQYLCICMCIQNCYL